MNAAEQWQIWHGLDGNDLGRRVRIERGMLADPLIVYGTIEHFVISSSKVDLWLQGGHRYWHNRGDEGVIPADRLFFIR
jgi:hypothetical protein